MHIKDSMEQTENYRLVSLLCIISKNLERCVCILTLNNYVNNSSALSSMTFLRNRSYITQLLSVFNANGQNLDKNIQTEVGYLDLVKAFDCVDL